MDKPRPMTATEIKELDARHWERIEAITKPLQEEIISKFWLCLMRYMLITEIQECDRRPK